MMKAKDLDLEKSTTEFLINALVNGTTSLAARECIASELKKRFYQGQQEKIQDAVVERISAKKEGE